jgi:hypothetical protein
MLTTMVNDMALTIILQIRTEFKMFVEPLGPARGTVVGNHCCMGGSIGQLRGKTHNNSLFYNLGGSPRQTTVPSHNGET